MAETSEWKPGLPKGKVTQKMLDTYEVYFSPGGMKWHRKKPKHEGADDARRSECPSVRVG